MPAKTKKVSASPAPTKKVVAKSGLKAGSGSAGNAPVKKVVAKRTAAKKMKPAVSVKVEEQIVPVVTVIEKEVPTAHGPVEVHHKYVFIGTCRNCNHMPMSANKLVAVLSLAIAILSGLLISTSLPINFQMPSISMGSLSDLITPDSNVQNL